MKRIFFKRTALLICLLLTALFLVRPGAGRLRWRVTQSISAALGRRVQIESVHLRFLPSLGFELENLVVQDDPSLGAEPLLRAPSVTAALRLTALLRGQFEISDLSLSEASLNLTRDSEGKWNLRDLLQRAARTSTAPTASAGQSRPEFPYIEATRARINFKIGAEKTHFALTDAQFALWQESENTWGMRLKAQPIRTDANLTDTGLVKVSGTWQRSPQPAETPLEFDFQWKNAQVGQVSRLIYGIDKGWRGDALLSGRLSGTPQSLSITADASIDALRRHDIFNGEDLRLSAHCVAVYSSTTNSVSDLDCSAPSGGGLLEVKGRATGFPFFSYNLTLHATEVSAQTLLVLARHATSTVPDGLGIEGTINSAITISREGLARPIQLEGHGEILDLSMQAGSTPALQLDRVPFSVSQMEASEHSHDLPTIEIGPVNAALGRPSAVQARGLISLAGYEASVRGEAGIKRLLQVVQMAGIPAPAVTVDGSSTLDLAVSGDWTGTERPIVSGTAQLRAVHAQVHGLNAPLEIRSANLILTKDFVRVQNLNAAAADAQWRGSILIPRPCPTPRDCTLQFNLHTTEVNATSLNNLLNPDARKRSWYRFLSLGARPVPYLLQVHATGRLSIEKLTIGTSSVSQIAGDVRLDEGRVSINNFRGATFGGAITADWNADFSAHPAIYRGRGTLNDVSLSQIAELTGDSWIDGTGSTTYEFKTAGNTLPDIVAAADFSSDFAIRDATFPHVVLSNKGSPLHASAFSGRLVIQEGEFSFQDAELESASRVYKISGTASLTGALNLKMASEGAIGYDLSGTFAKTRVSQITPTATRAALKP